MNKTDDIVNALGFSDAEIALCADRAGLLSLELEFTRKCNLRCIYCYSAAGEAEENELTLDEIKSVIKQASDLGAKKIVLLGGGEPLIFKGFTEIVKYISEIGLQQILFTNGTLITEELAELLWNNRVSVVIKNNSLKPEVQDYLAGLKGAYDSNRKGLEYLKKAGYPSSDCMLGIQTIICRQNLEELPYMWEWARNEGFIPYFEMLTNQGRAKEHEELAVSRQEVREVFDRLETIDQTSFNLTWHSRPTVAAFSCKRHLYSCLVNSRGYVQPCVGIDLLVGNIRHTPLADVLAESSVISDLRNIYDRIQGECRECDARTECYGCRGNAFQSTGNYLAADPSCWRCH